MRTPDPFFHLAVNQLILRTDQRDSVHKVAWTERAARRSVTPLTTRLRSKIRSQLASISLLYWGIGKWLGLEEIEAGCFEHGVE